MSRRFDSGSESTDCETVLESFEAYLDGDLAAADAAAVEAHLASCESCAAEHRLATAVHRELRALPQLDAPSAVLRTVLREMAGSRFRRVGSSAGRPAGEALAAAVLAVVIGAGLWQGWLRDAVETPATDPVVVAQATEEARYALAYLQRVSRRAGLMLRDDLLIERVVRPTARSLSRSLSPLAVPASRPLSEETTSRRSDGSEVDSDRS